MKKMSIFLILFVTMLFPSSIKAACSNSENVKLKNMASNINITYVFDESIGKFTIVISNLRPEIYLKTPSNQIMQYNNGNDILLAGYSPNESFGFKIYANSPNCPNKMVLTKYATTPQYNPFYKDAVCVGAEEYRYCQKWIKNPLNYENFVKDVNAYKQNKESKITTEEEKEVKGFYDYILEFYAKYYYFILPPVILVCLLLIHQRKKKEEFF